MLRSVKSLNGCRVRAIDGPVGKVHDLYFVDDSWAVAYIVVRLGSLVRGRKVLVCPDLFAGDGMGTHTVSVALTTARIGHLPGIEADLPVSLFEEQLLREYYEFPSRMGGGGLVPGPVLPPRLSAGEEQEIAVMQKDRNPHLRRMREVMRYRFRLPDGLDGAIDDIFVDDLAWRVAYFEVDTGGWSAKRRFLIEPKDVKKIRFGANEVLAEPCGEWRVERSQARRFPRLPVVDPDAHHSTLQNSEWRI